MIKLVVDAELEAKLTEAAELLEICGHSGQTLGYFQPALPPGGLKSLSPFSDAEIEKRRINRTGRPLSEILSDLDKA